MKLTLLPKYDNSRLKRVSTFIYHNAAKIIFHARQIVVKVQETVVDVINITIKNIKEIDFKKQFLK